MMSAAHYTRLVTMSRRLLWVLLAGMVGVVIWIASDNNGENGARLVFSSVPKSENLEDVMLKPHYQGIDAHNQPYTVIAERATQIDKNTVELATINADMLKNGSDGKDTWMALTAQKGELNTETKQMLLSGGVSMFYEGGYEFRSDHAQVDIQKGSAVGDSAVEGQGPMGTLTANSFEVNDHGRVIHFNGSVRMRLYP
jgi:lipopolysaccharide export system protein LptC